MHEFTAPPQTRQEKSFQKNLFHLRPTFGWLMEAQRKNIAHGGRKAGQGICITDCVQTASRNFPDLHSHVLAPARLVPLIVWLVCACQGRPDKTRRFAQGSFCGSTLTVLVSRVLAG